MTLLFQTFVVSINLSNMKNQTKLILCSSCLLILVLLFSYSPTASAQEVEDEREFDYLEGGNKGPSRWGDLRKEWDACKRGNLQSPIDMSSERVKVIPNMGEIKRSYNPWNATVANRGHDISLKWELGKTGSIKINDTEYFLQQCHWHSPSEHSINGRRYDLELHMVHISPDPNVTNKIAVVGVLYKTGRPDHFLSKLMRHVASMKDLKEERKMGMVDPRAIKMKGKKYYRYMGSLTVPPCTEGVIWTINKKIMTVSKAQVKLLREAVHDYAEQNARPVQPLNRREIHLSGPN